MKIGIDLSTFRSYQGTEVYAEHVVRELLALGTSHEFYIFKNKGMFADVENRATKIGAHIILNSHKNTVTSGVLLALYQQCILPFRIRARKIDVIFSPS